MIVKTNDPVTLAKEIFWLAWQACGGPLGMGVLHDAPGASREDVWDNICGSGDYPIKRGEVNRPYADYVFGRMMKLGLDIKEDCIEIRDFEPRYDYQSWCGVYPTVEELVNRAVLNVEDTDTR